MDDIGFNVQPYRDTVLTKIATEFHQIPHWLPMLGSPFCERYGFAGCSPRGALIKVRIRGQAAFRNGESAKHHG